MLLLIQMVYLSNHTDYFYLSLKHHSKSLNQQKRKWAGCFKLIRFNVFILLSIAASEVLEPEETGQMPLSYTQYASAKDQNSSDINTSGQCSHTLCLI